MNLQGKCLFICTISPLDNSVKSGGAGLTKANHLALQSIFGKDQVEVFSTLSGSPSAKWLKPLRFVFALFGYLGGASPFTTRSLVRRLRAKIRGANGASAVSTALNYSLVFIDHSQLGKLVEVVKKYSPQSKTIVSFQNIEFDYFGSSMKLPLRLDTVLKRAAFINEKTAIKLADSIICLAKEDSDRMLTIYGRSADKIIPITILSLANKGGPGRPGNFNYLPKPKPKPKPKPEGVGRDPNEEGLSEDQKLRKPVPYLLFCGSNFTPNVEGLKWFVANVLEHISYNLVVIGYQMESIKQRQEFQHPRLQIVGTVDDVSEFYRSAVAVINPVTSGSGMNTKSVEAIAYDKILVTSEFAVRGFPQPLPKNILVCKSAIDFIGTINSNLAPHLSAVDLTYFQKHFALESRIRSLREIL